VSTNEQAADVPPGLITLRQWAASHGRTYDYVRQFWRKRDGFPDPVGELPSRGRHGGGRGELLFSETALEDWFAAQPDLLPPGRIDPSNLPVDADERITLGRFASHIGKARGTVTQHRGRPGFPEADANGRYRAGDLLDYWNTRTGRRRPSDEPRLAVSCQFEGTLCGAVLEAPNPNRSPLPWAEEARALVRGYWIMSDRDPRRLELHVAVERDGDGQDALVVGGGHVLLVGDSRQRDGAGERTVPELGAMRASALS
jgi:hypothetical protein